MSKSAKRPSSTHLSLLVVALIFVALVGLVGATASYYSIAPFAARIRFPVVLVFVAVLSASTAIAVARRKMLGLYASALIPVALTCALLLCVFRPPAGGFILAAVTLFAALTAVRAARGAV